MKKKLFIAILTFLGTFSYSEPQKSLMLLESVVKLEYSMNVFANSYLLTSMYPKNISFREKSIQSLNQYDKALKEISAGLKNSSQYRVLVDFAKTKNFMTDLLDSRADNGSIDKLLNKCRAMESEASSVVDDKYSLLITDKNRSFAMGRLRWMVQSILREYLAAQTLAQKNVISKNGSSTENLNKATQAFVKLLEDNNHSGLDADRVNSITDSWKTLKRFLSKAGFPMIVKVGTSRISSLTRNKLTGSKPGN